MKHTLAFMAALAMTGAAAFAQAPIFLNNYDSGNPVYYLDTNTKLSETGSFVQIFGNGTSIGDKFGLVEPGFFDNGFGAIPGAVDGADVTVKVQVWRNAASFATATEKAEASWVQKGGTTPAAPAPPSPTALAFPNNVIVGTQGPIVPEPSTIALVLLGGAALLLRRRN